jgi:SulP family sulfate permease
VTVFIAFNFHRITTRIPGSIVAIVLSTFAVYFFHLPVETIETRFGEIPNRFGAPQIPQIDFQTVKALVQPAFAIALLGGIESLLSAVVADGMIGGRHKSNMELVAQGAANIFSSVFGGIPATGAIARTATNVKNGGRTPIAGIVHALVLLLIMLFLAPFAKLIPMACLAGILIVVAYNMSEWRHFLDMLRGNRMDILVLLTTFLLTIVFDLVIAIEIGMVLASFLFMKRMSESVSVQTVTPEVRMPEKGEILFEEEIQNLPKGVILYEINGPLFFGASQEFQDTLSNIHLKPKVIILRMRYVPFIDATGSKRLKEVIRDFRKRKIRVILSGVNASIQEDFEKTGVYDVISREQVFSNINEAVSKAREIVSISRKAE